MAMESVSLKHVSLVTTRRNPSHGVHLRRRICCRPQRSRSGVICFKLSDFQDFQGYAKPVRLLPAEQVKVCGEKPSLSADGCISLYKIRLQTSNLFGSNLSDLSSRVLMCLIDEKGDSVLQTISAGLSFDQEGIGFQRGCVDDFVFRGPKLGKIQAFWISLESGQWRLGGTSLTVIDPHVPLQGDNNGGNSEYVALQYEFQTDDILLGEGSDLSMVELRPILVTKQTGDDPSTLLHKIALQTSSNSSSQISNEESMKEYADLKLSLLLYDAILTLLGTSALSFTFGQESAIAFCIGGTTGFLYLLLLQRSVDGLQVPGAESKNPEEYYGQLFRGIKVPVLTLALAIGVAVLAVKSNTEGDSSFGFTAKELLIGMLGFLICKLAVVLAAVKPVSGKSERLEK